MKQKFPRPSLIISADLHERIRATCTPVGDGTAGVLAVRRSTESEPRPCGVCRPLPRRMDFNEVWVPVGLH